MIRRVLAVISLAIVWAVGWAALGALVGVGVYLYLIRAGGNFAILDSPMQASPFWTIVVVFVIGFARGGAVSGALFAIVLALAEQRRSLDHLRRSRVALWGVVGSWLIPGTLILVSVARYGLTSPWLLTGYLTLIGIAGAVSATTTLLIARRAPASAAA